MTSEERHEARYRRRLNKRKEKRDAEFSRLGGYDEIFSYERLYDAFYSCEKGVRQKGSVQTYEAILPFSTLTIFRMMQKRKFKPMGFLEFDLMERGKKRHIRALKIAERCIQRSLCNNYLLPILEKRLIYDNGASIKGKGIDFSLKRLKRQLLKYYQKYHTNEGYVLQYDFKSYFDNIDHSILLEQLRPYIKDNEIFTVVEQMIKCFGEKGLGLGSQISQIAAIYYPNLLDKYFKEVLRCKGYIRYMDDGIIICHNLEEVEKCKNALFDLCSQLNIIINIKKLTVSKLSKTFIFLKKRIRLTETGGVVMRIGAESNIRARRKLKKLIKKALNPQENFTYLNFYQCYKSQSGSAEKYQNYYIIQNYRRLFLTLTSYYNSKIKLLGDYINA